MSLILRTIQAFPRGRTTEELLALTASSFDRKARMALVSELEGLAAEGRVRLRPDGRWIASEPPRQTIRPNTSVAKLDPSLLRAAPFQRETTAVVAQPQEETRDLPDPRALLRYWRSALRADPRGAIVEVIDRHGAVWHLISGQGPLVPELGQELKLSLPLDGLAPDFRTALLRREGNENALALGWPLAIGKRSGVTAIWPVGLLAASWTRIGETLEIRISADDVMANPEWIKGAARTAGWTAAKLAEIFETEDGVGLTAEDFLSRLREAMAGGLKGKVTGDWLAGEIDAERQGILDAAGLFLPDDSSFTAGAARDLDVIATWEDAKLSGTALAPLLGLGAQEGSIPSINVGPLNGEQITALRQACSAPLSVITGPPGTGKSQVIVSIAASVLMAGGSVLVTSKNHQALDAVEERLGALCPDTPFVVRTLDGGDTDRSFSSVLTEMIQGETRRTQAPDEAMTSRLVELARQRARAIDLMTQRDKLECDLADVLERIEAKARFAPAEPKPMPLSFWQRLWARFRPAQEKIAPLDQKLAMLRQARDGLGQVQDPVVLTEEVTELARRLMGPLLANRAHITPERRDMLDQAKADADFARRALPAHLARAILDHRPLWLASVLGTPKRIPLEPGLFDLVIFDEASQCDIASALPLFARAKRAVVVGDNRQLNFIAGLGLAQDRNLMQAQGLPVQGMGRFAQSQQSLFDFAQRVPGAARTLLRQQYRSAGPIVDYISDAFYGGALKTAYDPAQMKPPAGQKPGIAWTHVPAPMASEGANTNSAEVRAITAHLDRLFAQGYDGTVGVTTPFRDQVLALEEAIRAAIPGQKLEGAEFRVATVDGFQGQERDVILFSPVVGATSRMTTLTFLQKDHRRLNVAISRARAVAHVFGDLDFARSGRLRTLGALASAATEPRKRRGEGVFDSEWERILDAAMRARGLRPVPQYEIAGRRLDFALFGRGEIKLDVEVDGRFWHQNIDGSRKQSDLWRDHQLKSLGWRVRRFWVDELSKDMEACLDLIERDLAAVSQ